MIGIFYNVILINCLLLYYHNICNIASFTRYYRTKSNTVIMANNM